MYKINIHAHSHFSDGSNSLIEMAEEAKRLDFCSLVVTDHYYPSNPDEWCSANKEKHKLIHITKKEIKDIPVIIGMEVPVCNEEILVFGKEAISRIHNYTDKLSVEYLKALKNELNCAFILCHPMQSINWFKLYPILDGYERYNSAQDMFSHDRELSCLENLPSWSNSDAHHIKTMYMGYNIIDEKIETENDLIQYIKSGKQPQLYHIDR